MNVTAKRNEDSMPINNKDYTDSLIVMENAVRTLRQQLPDKKWDNCLQAVKDLYRAGLAMDIYLQDKANEKSDH